MLKQKSSLEKHTGEDQAKAEQSEKELNEVRKHAKVAAMRLAELRRNASKAKEKENASKAKAEAASNGEADREKESRPSAADLEATRLKSEIEALRKERLAAAGSRSSNGQASFEAEFHKRLEAEQNCQEVEKEMQASIMDKFRPALKGLALPIALESDRDGTTRLSLENAMTLRRLYQKQQKHGFEIRDLMAVLDQQIRDRTIEQEAELDCVFGQGLPRLLAALKEEGFVSQYREPAVTPELTKRLRQALCPK
eukprot:TRINITY_DN2848_c0_g1_i11.p1 TRINITY_DN2848_c0_g1~~TRINITY_DN2848_c0_g1_i11.p1  ORF type:complete len:254 (+),score=69.04 TRINITY_DN2848_c0_g1_i11:342-1103(+)